MSASLLDQFTYPEAVSLGAHAAGFIWLVASFGLVYLFFKE